MSLNLLQNLIVPPLLAIQFLTRVPVPGLSRLRADEVQVGLVRAVIWFPLAGGLVGIVSAGVIIGALNLWPRMAAVLIALIVEARLTGAFHEDAVADFCDGFGGGSTPTRIHEIMKDSRIGAYGSVGLVLALGLRFALLTALPEHLILAAVVASTAFGRWLAVVPKALLPSPPGVEGMAGLIVEGTGLRHLGGASVVLVPFVLPFVWLAPVAAVGVFVAAAAFVWWLCVFLRRHLGGVTGDCLGFAVYAGQLLVLLAACARWPV